MFLENDLVKIVIIGRPNVGKSSLINRLTRSHTSVVTDIAGTTLDIKYIIYHTPRGPVHILDTAGWLDHPDILMSQAMDKIKENLKKVDYILFVIDGKVPLNPLDWAVRELILKTKKPISLIVNKVDDGLHVEANIGKLGFKDVVFISAKAGYNLQYLEDKITALVPQKPLTPSVKLTRVSLIGKPNAGKSTLFNSWVGQDLQLISDLPGTTRDTHTYPISCLGKKMLLVDTAGLRRGIKRQGLEIMFAQHTDRALAESDIVIAMVRIDTGLTEQDRRLLKNIYEDAKAMLIVLSQCDRIIDKTSITKIKTLLQDWYPNIDIIPFAIQDNRCFIRLQKSVLKAERSLKYEMNSSKLTRILEDLITAVPPPRTAVSQIKPRFAHPIPNKNKNLIIIKGKQVVSLPLSYQRYLLKGFITALSFPNRPLSLFCQNDNNPYHTNEQQV